MSEIPQAALLAAKRVLLEHRKLNADGQPLDACGRVMDAEDRLADDQSRRMVQAALDKMGIRVEEQDESGWPLGKTYRRFTSPWLPVEPSDG